MGKLSIEIGEYFNSPFGGSGGSTIGDLVGVIVTSAIVISGTMLLFYFVIGGVSMIAGAGQQNPERVAKGRQAVTTSLIGFIIVFMAYWIIRLIELLTNFHFITNPTI